MLLVNGFDQYWLSFFRSLPDSLTPLFHLITYLGDSPVLIVPAIVALALGKKEVKALAAVLIVGLLVGNMVMGDVKDIVQRPRPEGPRIQDYLAQMSYAFPSGHAVTAFVAASILGGYLGWKARAAGYALAALVAISRLYLIVHYATDVIAGALIGVLIGEMAVLIAYRLNICESMGLLRMISLFSKRKREVVNTGMGAKGGIAGSMWFNVAIALALVVVMAAYFAGYSLIAIALTLVIPVIVIVSNNHRVLTENADLIIVLFTVLMGMVATFLAYLYAAFSLSLLIVIAIVIALLWFTHPYHVYMSNGES